MQITSKIILAAFVLVNAFTLSGSAQIVGIGIQFKGSGTALGTNDSAGLSSVAQTNWNVVTGASFSSLSLTGANGTAGAVLNGSSNGTYFGSSSSTTPSGNNKLVSGELFNGWPGSPTLTISSIPYATYDVYLYAGIDAAGRNETTGLTPSGGSEMFYSFLTEGGGSTWTQATSTWNGSGTAPALTSANYVEYTDLTASSFTLAWGAPGNGGLNGIQIVQDPVALVPEPSSVALMLVGLGGLAFFVRRRNLMLAR